MARTPWVFHAITTCGVVFLAFLAFADITAGREPSLALEYAALAACAVWLLFLSGHLLWCGHRVLGGASLAVLLAAAWGQRAVGPGITPGFWPEYLTVTGAFVWFAVLALLLFGLDWRAPRAVGG